MADRSDIRENAERALAEARLRRKEADALEIAAALPSSPAVVPSGWVTAERRALRALTEASRAVLTTLKPGQSLSPAGASLTNRLDSITAEIEASLAAAPSPTLLRQRHDRETKIIAR